MDGPRTRLWKLQAQDCPELSAHRIARLGWDDAGPRYRRVRLVPAGSFLLGCAEGEGRILPDFGLVKHFAKVGFSGLTVTGTYAGTPVFLAREQIINFKYATQAGGFARN